MNRTHRQFDFHLIKNGTQINDFINSGVFLKATILLANSHTEGPKESTAKLFQFKHHN